MTVNKDEAKGRAKEAAGALTNNDSLRSEGKTDQTVGEIKDVADKVNAKVDKKIDDIRERADRS